MREIAPVLPATYGMAPWENTILPNCVGISTFLAGIVRHLFGLRAYALMPTALFDCRIESLRAEYALRIRDIIAQDSFGEYSNLDYFIEKFEGEYLKGRFQSDETHLGLVVEIEPGVWRIADVNFFQDCPVPMEWRIPEIDELLSATKTSYSGLSVGVEWNNWQWRLGTLENDSDELLAAGEELVQRIAALNEHSLEGLASAIVGSKTETLVAKDWDVYERLQNLDDKVERAKLLAWAISEDCSDSSEEVQRNTTSSPLSDEESLFWLRIIPMFPFRDAGQLLDDIWENGYSLRKDKLDWYESAEILDLDAAVGTLVLSHVSVVMDEIEDVQAMLARHTNMQWQMLYAATAPLRMGCKPNPVSLRAVEALETIPPTHRIPGIASAFILETLNYE